MSEPIYAYKVPRRSFFERLFFRPCEHHDWQPLTATMSVCSRCRTDRIRLGVLVLESTCQFQDCEEMLTWQIPTYTSKGWVVPSARPHEGGAR